MAGHPVLQMLGDLLSDVTREEHGGDALIARNQGGMCLKRQGVLISYWWSWLR